MILKKWITTLILISSLSAPIYAQKVALGWVSTDTVSFRDFSVDPMERLVLLYDDSIVKVSIDFIKREPLTSLDLGKYTIDCKFPLKTLVFNRDKNYLQIINSRAGILSEINFDMLKIYQPTFVQFSSDGMIWAYDNFNNILYKLNENNQIKFFQKDPFQYNGILYKPVQFLDFKNQVFVLDSNHGVLQLNNYGEIDKSYELKGVRYAFSLKNNIILVTDSSMYKMNLDINVLEELNWSIPTLRGMKRMEFCSNHLLILYEGGIFKKYKFKF